MAKYVVILKDKAPSVLTKKIYYSHVDHLRRLAKEGVLFLAGPMVEAGKVLQIIEAANRDDAERYALADPYVSEKYFAGYDIFEFIESNEANNWLMDTPRIKEMLSKLP